MIPKKNEAVNAGLDELESNASRLRALGLRVTPQRKAVWAAFEGGRAGHLSADEVLRRARRQLPGLSQGTVYNALGEFVAAGLLRAIASPGARLYDPNLEPHHHFRCRGCGRLHDIQPARLGRRGLTETGFLVEGAEVIFEGLCPNCVQGGRED